ncbi:MAG: VTT domain-containing protein [Candidatus Paceibacterota bacterium]|jgi:uncharacterized membrane protein YdjX (TVP38/TMEM64 family)
MNKRIVISLIIVVIATLLFWVSKSIQDEFYLIVAMFNNLAEQNILLTVLIFLSVAAFAALISPFTNVPLIPVAVAIWGIIPTTILLLIGWLSGDIITYIIGRYLGYPVIRYLIVSTERFDNWVNLVRDRTSFLKALTLRMALPAELGYVFGLIKYKFSTYFLITFLSELPLAIIFTYASQSILTGDIPQFFGFIGLLCIILFGTYELIHQKKKHRKDLEESTEF